MLGLLKMALAMHGLRFFQMYFGIALPSGKYHWKVYGEIALNLLITFVNLAIFTMLTMPIQEHETALQDLVSSLTSLCRILIFFFKDNFDFTGNICSCVPCIIFFVVFLSGLVSG